MKKLFNGSCFKIEEALQEGINEYHRLAGNIPDKKITCAEKTTNNTKDRKSSWLLKVFIFLGRINK